MMSFASVTTMKIMRIAGVVAVVIVVAVCAVVLFVYMRYGIVNIPSGNKGVIVAASPTVPLSVPDGYRMTLFAEEVPGARAITFDTKGTMLLSQTSEGVVTALPDDNGDGRADRQITVAEGLNRPHGLALRCEGDACTLYVAETNALAAFEYDVQTKVAQNRRVVLTLPGGLGHFTRSLLFLPSPEEHILLVSVGSSCNVCEESDARRAKILWYDTVSGESGVYASGLRNAVFMAVHPITRAVWATEMGRDGLGDDIPPDEIDIIERGGWYGWPWFYGKNVEDLTYSPDVRPAFAQEPIPSHIDLQAHSAPLGLAFIPEGWSPEDRNDLLVAYHGSWNRSAPTGYKIVKISLDDQGSHVSTDDLITGFLPGGEKIGRPVDIQILDGIAYISDDYAGVVYRLQWVGQ